MRILLTNDDGYLAEGIRTLAGALVERGHEVVAVTPDRERSGSGRAITLNHPLRLTELDPPPAPGRWLLVNGTPTDCVNLGVHYVLSEKRPDLLLSGINHGLNLGDDMHYSGTVAAACEAHQHAIPSIAVSQELGRHDFHQTAARVVTLLDRLFALELEEPPLLNINFPEGEPPCYRLTRPGRRVYRDVVVAKTDPRGVAYYWLAGKPHWEEDDQSDQDAILQGVVSVSPLNMRQVVGDQLRALGELLHAREGCFEL